MPPTYLDRKEQIRIELLRCARAKPMERPTYTELGKVVGIPKQGPWRTVLDQIAKEELAAGRPDITFLVTNSVTGHPSRMKFKTKSKPDEDQERYAVKRMQEIIDEYNQETENLFVKLGW